MKIVNVIIAAQIFAIIVSLGAIIYLIVMRVRKKKNEHFEKRNN